MKDAIETAIQALVAKSTTAFTAHEAMQYAQAAQNLAHALETIKNAQG